MVELVPIGWVLSPIMKIVVDRAKLYLGSQYNWKEDMQNNLEKLKNTLIGIQTIVDAAEQMQSKNPSQEQLLYQLKDTIYEADDLLDEFDYQILETQAMEDRGWLSHGAYSSLKFAKRLIGQDKLLSRLKELLNKLDSISENAKSLNVQAAGCERSNAIQLLEIKHVRLTSSIPPHQTFGQAKEKEELINLLLNDPQSSHTNTPVIAIVGDGGIGKTTLAQLVYNEQKIIEKFRRRIWICVSDDFDEIMITWKILECASGSNEKYKHAMDFDYLQRELQNELQSEEFLLVLDDVWSDEKKNEYLNQAMWEKLLAPLQKGKKGSKTLVTTRMRMVVEMFNAKSSMISLVGLTNDETWSLLEKCAFDDGTSNKYPELQRIGMQIAERLRGSPLAAKVVGAMLKGRLDVKYWLEISKRKIYDNIMSILGLSYQCLPHHLKHCFAYCSIFPKDWKFEAKKLVSLWIAQGYVLPDGTERPLRDIGMDYFNQLFSRSLFEKVEQDFDIHYVMHDLIHDLAQYVSKDECFRIDGGKQGKILETIRHLGIVINCVDELQDILSQLEKMSNLKSLCTLMLFGNARWSRGDLLLGILKVLKSLRVLDFGTSTALEFPETLCHCLHLRYLNLGQMFNGILPESLTRLYHLQVMSANQLQLSESMFRLLKFGELKFLAVVGLEFKVGRKRSHRIGVLRDMGMEMVVEGHLCILNLENVTDKAEAAEADLGSKQYLAGLELQWDSSSARINGHDADQAVAEALKPHPNLKRLTIEGFRGSMCPSWLESKWLDSLQSLSLIDCSELEVLPPLDHLPSLKICTVEGCPKLMSFSRFPPTLAEIIIRETGFPRFPRTLGEIIIRETGLISELFLQPSSSPKCFHLFTRGISSHTALLHDHHLQAIQELYIRDCKEPMPAKWLLRLGALKLLDVGKCQEWLMSDEEDGGGVLPSSLESLHIYSCPVTEKWLSRCLQGLISLKELIVNDCPELKSLPQEDGGGVLATSLDSLEIWGCPVADLSLISHCRYLKKLRVTQCHELKFLPKEGLPTSLEEVCFRGCGVPKESVVRCLQGLPSLSKLTVDFWTHFTAFTSLLHLTIVSCRCEPNSTVELPESLQSLEISGCDVSDTLLSTCLQGLTSLSELEIRRCNGLTSLPSAQVLHRLTALHKLTLADLNELTSLGALHALASLKHLDVKACPKLTSLPDKGLPSSIEYFYLKACHELMSLDALHALASLKYVQIEHCPKVKSLPKEGLPSSIQIFYLSECHPALKQNIHEKKGLDWNKVARIPSVIIL